MSKQKKRLLLIVLIVILLLLFLIFRDQIKEVIQKAFVPIYGPDFDSVGCWGYE